MPPKPLKDGIVIALDVGKSVSTLHDYEEKSFFKQARDCISWIIQRKIISQSVDLLSLILIGCDESSSNYKNICLKFDFQEASWDMLKFIVKEVESTNIESDWSKALMYSVDLLRAVEEYECIRNKKVVILSDFTHSPSVDLNVIVKTIQKSEIEVTIIGPDHPQPEVDSDEEEEPENKRKKLEKSPGRQEGEKVVYDLWKRLPENIVICTFESALKQLCSYTPKTRRLSYWNCIMDIGDVFINISILKKTDPKTSKRFDTKCIKLGEGESSRSTFSGNFGELAPTIKDTVMHYKHGLVKEHNFVDVEVKPEDTVEGYRYGTTVIPFSEADKTAMQYKPGPKSFSVVGFTRTSNVPYYLLSGECSYLVLPREKDKNAEVALSALIQGMKKSECLAVVRRVYSDDRGLSLGILYPITEEIFSDDTDDVSYREYLLFVELAFQDDIKFIDFPSLESFSKAITEKQCDAIDDLIEGMNLMKADKGLRGEPCEAFDLPYLHDVKQQFFHYCVIQRGLYPDKLLPTEIPSYIKNYIEVPKSVAQNCKSAIGNIKKLFKVTKVDGGNGSEDQKKKNWFPSKNIEHFSESVVEEQIDAMTRTWMRLFQKGFPSVNELEELFVKLNSEDLEASKVAESFGVVIRQIREKYLNPSTNPQAFNKWMVEFKKFLGGNEGVFGKLWEIIFNESGGLITKRENENSSVTVEEALEYLKYYINNSSESKSEKPNFESLDELQAEQMNLDSSMF